MKNPIEQLINHIDDAIDNNNMVGTMIYPNVESALLALKEKAEKLFYIQKNYDVFLDNQEFLQVMNISKRTAQDWRDKGVIPYSQIGAKIYYRFSDIEELLNKNYKNNKLNK